MFSSQSVSTHIFMDCFLLVASFEYNHNRHNNCSMCAQYEDTMTNIYFTCHETPRLYSISYIYLSMWSELLQSQTHVAARTEPLRRKNEILSDIPLTKHNLADIPLITQNNACRLDISDTRMHASTASR